MFKRIFLCVALSISGASYADKCDGVHDLAESIMKARQSLVPVKQSMTIAKNDENENVVKVATKMVISAYSKPAFSSDDGKRRIIAEFANEYYLICLKSVQ